ncbi:MAG: SH3 domain-containing protein [Acidimicrobiia bacterium]
MRSSFVWIGSVLTVLLLVGACGGGDETGSTTTTSLVTTTISKITTATTTAGTSTTVPGSTTTTSTGLPGEPIDFGPAQGDTLAVIGVAHDDVLNLRAAPGADQQILDGIPPVYDALTALGETRELPESFWIAVDYQGTEGWASLRFIGYLGDTTDDTAAMVTELGETPSAGTMLDLGLIVAESLASDEPPSDLVVKAVPRPKTKPDSVVKGSRHPKGRPTNPSLTAIQVPNPAVIR